MLGKVYNLLAAVALATLLATGGFVGVLFGTGKLDADRLGLLAQALRGELKPGATTTQPTTQPADEESEAVAAGHGATEEEVRRLRKREHLERLETERAARDLEAQRRLLDQVLAHAVQEQERLAAQRKDLELAAQQKSQVAAAQDAGFAKELELVSNMQPRQAKEHLLRVWRKQPVDAVRLIKELDESRVKRIMDQFKTAEEMQIQSELLEQVRLQTTTGPATASRMTTGAAAP